MDHGATFPNLAQHVMERLTRNKGKFPGMEGAAGVQQLDGQFEEPPMGDNAGILKLTSMASVRLPLAMTTVVVRLRGPVPKSTVTRNSARRRP